MVLVATRRHAGKAQALGVTNSKRWRLERTRCAVPRILVAIVGRMPRAGGDWPKHYGTAPHPPSFKIGEITYRVVPLGELARRFLKRLFGLHLSS